MTVLLVFSLLIIVPALFAFLANTALLPRIIVAPALGVGAPIVYRRQEISTRPRSDAISVQPSERGEFYYCTLVNYLRVTHVLDDGRIIAITRDNHRFCFWPNDSQLRKPRLKERLIYRRRFAHLPA